MSLKQIHPSRTLIAGALTVLAACGGEGGDLSQVEVSVSPSPQPLNQQTTQPIAASQGPSYETGSPHRAVFDAINAARTQCGWTTLTSSLKLDLAAQGQADYETARWNDGTGYQFVTQTPHRQSEEHSQFTGKTLADRLAAAAYAAPFGTAELSGRTDSRVEPNADSALALRLVDQLTTTVYHLALLVGHGTEVGVGFGVARSAPTSLTNYPMATLVLTVGASAPSPPETREATLKSWPCERTEIPWSWPAGEWPNPIPNDLNWGLPFGPPIYLRSPGGTTLQLTSASVTDYRGEFFLMSYLNDPNARLQSNDAFVLLRSPLAPGLSYTASFSGTIDGAPFTHQFTFSTK